MNVQAAHVLMEADAVILQIDSTVTVCPASKDIAARVSKKHQKIY